MTIAEAIQNRHSVRSYLDKEIPQELTSELSAEIAACNSESGLNIQLITNEAQAFSGFMAHYGKFSGVKNYIALVGKQAPDLDEKAGYYGERLVLKSQMLGLNSCWVGASYSKGKCGAIISSGEKLVCVISLGYGVSGGTAHKSKAMEALCKTDAGMPDWFRRGMEEVMLAPTAINQQKFLFTLSDGKVKAEAGGWGFGYAKIDLGIAKYHFEYGAGRENFRGFE